MEKDIKENKEKDNKNKENEEKETLGVENDIRVIIKSKTDGVLFDQDCCTVINIILNNEAEIATSFLGVHNESIIKAIEKAQKVYFKALKKSLKEERKRAKEILDTDSDQEKNSDAETKVNSEEYIHHVKKYDSSNTENKTEQNENSKKSTPDNDTTITKTIDSDTGSFEHVCDENGCRLVKKRLDPKTSPDDVLTPASKQSKNKKQASTKQSSNKIATKTK